jgi:hypothetical protein
VDEAMNECQWTQEECDSTVWTAACDPVRLFEFNDGGPSDSHFRFCPYCGKPLREVAYLDTIEDEDDAKD